MNQNQLFRLVDRALDGRLAEILRGYQAEGLAPGRMALRLAAEHQVEVSGPTLKKWLSALPPREAVCAAQTAQTVDAGRVVVGAGVR